MRERSGHRPVCPTVHRPPQGRRAHMQPLRVRLPQARRRAVRRPGERAKGRPEQAGQDGKIVCIFPRALPDVGARRRRPGDAHLARGVQERDVRAARAGGYRRAQHGSIRVKVRGRVKVWNRDGDRRSAPRRFQVCRAGEREHVPRRGRGRARRE